MLYTWYTCTAINGAGLLPHHKQVAFISFIIYSRFDPSGPLAHMKLSKIALQIPKQPSKIENAWLSCVGDALTLLRLVDTTYHIYFELYQVRYVTHILNNPQVSLRVLLACVRTIFIRSYIYRRYQYFVPCTCYIYIYTWYIIYIPGIPQRILSYRVLCVGV